MPSQASLYDDQYYTQYPYQSQTRYHQGSYPSVPSQTNVSLLGNTSDSLTSYGTRQAWSTDSQHAGSEYGSPSGTPYSEYAPSSSEQEYYSGPSGGSVGYPESSQRTHVSSNGAYPAVYSSRYYGTAETINGAAAARVPDTPEDEQVAFRYSESSDHSYSPHRTASSPLPIDSSRRGNHGSWNDTSSSPSAFDRLTAQVSASFSRPDAVSQLPGQTSASYLLGRSSATSIPSSHESRAEFSSREATRDSPRQPSYSFQSRLPSLTRLGEPGNPSVVPPLVFDGEEYDDDSECSLPSAGSDAYRTVYQGMQSPAQYSSSASESGLSYSASGSAHGRSEPRSSRSSTTPPSESSSGLPDLPTQDRPKTSHKKSKMHQCNVCSKWFPRPSGLATHMNSHSGAKPYKCPIQTCTKSFAVRSNAKRHLRTHGIFPTSEHNSAPSQYTVGFDAPIISEVHDVGKLPSKLRWVPQSLASRTNVDFLRDAPSDSEDEYPPSCPVLSVPLPAVVPSSPKWDEEDYEDRNSYEDMGPSPYLNSQQWRALPGPAIVTSGSL